MNLDLPAIRQKIHEHPELSGMEKQTSAYLVKLLSKFSPDKIVKNIGGYGIAAVFDSKKTGPTIMFRCELDALPITELENLPYKSRNLGVSHKCGHDGHMAILIGLAQEISYLEYSGKIILLFQPAEETAEGASLILEDQKFKLLKPDYIFALHNLPGFEKGSTIFRKGFFTSTSIGMIMDLQGKTSHAGHPENGINPAPAMTKIIDELIKLPKTFHDYALITIIYAKLGEIAFGTSPGKAVVMATFRSHTKDMLDMMQQKATDMVTEIALHHKLDHTIEWVEYFPEIINDDKCVKIIEKAARNTNQKVEFIKQPFTWTEDFSYFTQKIKGAFFGLGAGKEHRQLHNSDYDFPDEIIEPGIDILTEIIKVINEEKL
ncbi:MAG: amidohydrolase [Candidatus Tenebribacter burtonii]|jgi:amidohydrolase|nr:amidohydrolase [Candidatus Tenebribacter burtonii]